MEEGQSLLKICVKIGPKKCFGTKTQTKYGQNGQHLIESTLLSQFLTVKDTISHKNHGTEP